MSDAIKQKNQRYKFVTAQSTNPLSALGGVSDALDNNHELRVYAGDHSLVDILVISTAQINQITNKPEPLFIAVAVLEKNRGLRVVEDEFGS